MENVVKIYLTVISNDPGFKLFTLNQVIDEVLLVKSLICFVKVIHQREVI